MRKKVLCAVAVYNESFNLPNLFKDVEDQALADYVDFVFIDDFSTDHSVSLIQNAGYEVLSQPEKGGYGGAVKMGMRLASERGYQYMVLFPGDHQRQANDVKKLISLALKTNHDVIVGSKFHIYSEFYKGSIGRKFGNKLYSNFAKFFWNSSISDVLSGFKIYKVARTHAIMEVVPQGYPLDIVFSLYASRQKLIMSEIPVNCRYDQNTTKMKSIALVSMNMMLHLLTHLFYFEFLNRRKLQMALEDTRTVATRIEKVL